MASHVLEKFQCFVLLLWLQLASQEKMVAASRQIAKPGCQDTCEDVSIPYPFGISDGCFIEEAFEIKCNNSMNPLKPMSGGLNVLNISIFAGEMTAEVYIANDCSDNRERYEARANLRKFTFSETKNKFIAIGCNTLALFFLRSDLSIGTGCSSFCNKVDDTINGSCSGIGCCEIAVPSGLSAYAATVDIVNRSTSLSFNPCSYSFLVEDSSFKFSSSYLKDFKSSGTETLPAVVDWTIGNETCDAVVNSMSYACGPNSACINSTIPGYRCKCLKGYEGNPYLNDIDECHDNPCKGKGSGSTCINTMGSYNCSCKYGYRSQFNDDGTFEYCLLPESKLNKIVVGGCLGLSLLLGTCFGLYWAYRKRKHMKLKEELYKQNGGLFLDRLLKEREEDTETSTDSSGGKKGRSIVTIYTEKELSKATNNYHDSRILGLGVGVLLLGDQGIDYRQVISTQGGFGTVYKGTLSNGEVVAIKKTKVIDRKQNEQFINEIVVLSQINHRNVVQLLGCCLKSTVPLLVYEYVTNGTLSQHLHDRENRPESVLLMWEDRLRIAADVAGSLAYLHAEAIIPIIHRDVKSCNILLDSDYKAKVSDFGASRLIPIDQTELNTLVQGTLEYLDPEYHLSDQLTQKSDVYSFGVLLAELLTGNKAALT
ncbi:wall-associated receptor kinase 2-like [Papaver somniferum]|uniref:wall-associated receptor kinase 2-like n=1 Tax=Papaver somniferum TaxID=3469 RepID=UPI000E6FD8EC|nr:wall-associated receptor kinase 2-like [Papaver somniferum]